MGGSACPDVWIGGWGDGDLELDDRTDTGGWCGGPELGGTSVVGEGGCGFPLTDECLGRGKVGGVDLEETFEGFTRSGSRSFKGTSILDTGAGCLSFLTVAAVILTRFGFLARSLVGCNAAKRT